jgi:hypothetical protein
MGKEGKRQKKSKLEDEEWKAAWKLHEPELDALYERDAFAYKYHKYMSRAHPRFIKVKDIPDLGHLPADMRACLLGSYKVIGQLTFGSRSGESFDNPTEEIYRLLTTYRPPAGKVLSSNPIILF